MTGYSDRQIASGLRYLTDNACGGDIRLFSHASVPQAARPELVPYARAARSGSIQ